MTEELHPILRRAANCLNDVAEMSASQRDALLDDEVIESGGIGETQRAEMIVDMQASIRMLQIAIESLT